MQKRGTQTGFSSSSSSPFSPALGTSSCGGFFWKWRLLGGSRQQATACIAREEGEEEELVPMLASEEREREGERERERERKRERRYPTHPTTRKK